MRCSNRLFHKLYTKKRTQTLSNKSAKTAIATILVLGSFVPVSIWGAEQVQQATQVSYSDTVQENHYKGSLMPAEQPLYPFSPVVQISEGNIRGEIADHVVQWKGIPYAIATRWAAPIAPDKWSGIKETTDNAPTFIQANKDIITGVDDNLTLDVYRPNNSDTNLPILFFIHGNGNKGGDSSDFDASQLAAEANAVVISVNYRLGLLGFINLPALKTGNPLTDSGNFALLDLHQALEWTIKNANSFGGNNKNITVSGMGAGAQDALSMTISPIFKGKFQRVLALHGGAVTSDYNKSQAVDARILAKIAVDEGKFSNSKDAEKWLQTSGSDVKTWLYNIRSTELVRALRDTNLRMGKFPQLFTDGKVLDRQGYDTSSYNSVPVMFISGFDEFSLAAGHDSRFFNSYEDGSLLLKKENTDLLHEFEFAKKYGSALFRYQNTEGSAQKFSTRSTEPIYTALIKWGSDERYVGRDMQRLVGSYHGITMPLLTNQPSKVSTKYPNAFKGSGYTDMRTQFVMYIRNYLRSGNPNANGLVNWAKWSPTKEAAMLFDADLEKAIIKQSAKHTNYDAISTDIRMDSTLSNFQKTRVIHEILNGRFWSADLDKEYNSVDFWIH